MVFGTIALEDRVTSVLTEFTKSGQPFTVLDISNAVKKDGNGFARHREIRPIVVDMIENETVWGIEDYIVTQIQVSTPKGIDYANLYHLEDDDPEDYTDRQQKALSPSELGNVTTNDQDDDQDNSCINAQHTIFTHSTPVAPVKSNMSQNAREFKLPKPRYNGSIEIPKKLLETSNLLDKEVVIQHHPNSISIKLANSIDENTRIARKGMRISISTLRKSNLEGRTNYEAAAFTEKIVIA